MSAIASRRMRPAAARGSSWRSSMPCGSSRSRRVTRPGPGGVSTRGCSRGAASPPGRCRLHRPPGPAARARPLPDRGGRVDPADGAHAGADRPARPPDRGAARRAPRRRCRPWDHGRRLPALRIARRGLELLAVRPRGARDRDRHRPRHRAGDGRDRLLAAGRAAWGRLGGERPHPRGRWRLRHRGPRKHPEQRLPGRDRAGRRAPAAARSERRAQLPGGCGRGRRAGGHGPGVARPRPGGVRGRLGDRACRRRERPLRRPPSSSRSSPRRVPRWPAHVARGASAG